MEEKENLEGKTIVQKDRFLPISIVVAAVLIAGSVVFATFYKPAAPQQVAGGGAAATTTAQAPSAAALAALQLTPHDAILGDANAPVTVIEYGDYQCPFCTRYFQQVQPLIVQQYVNTGKAKMVFRDFPFLDQAAVAGGATGESHAAAAAAYCAEDQNQFWPYHDALYTAKIGDEAKGGGENDSFYTPTLFLQIAGRLGLNATTFANCIDSGKYASTTTADYTTAQLVGVDSTPTTFVNGKMVVDASGNSVGADGTAVLQAIANAAQGS
jgi:protein-disulfide isomerase